MYLHTCNNKDFSGQGFPGRKRTPSQKGQQQRPLVKPRPSSLEDQSILNKQDLTRSPRSDGGTRKTDRRARYWKFLFDNLQRAVDAIYETCEQDESVVECKVNVYHVVDSNIRCLIARGNSCDMTD